MQQSTFNRGQFLGAAERGFRPMGPSLGCLPCMMKKMKEESEEEFRRQFGVVGSSNGARLNDRNVMRVR